MNSSKFHQVLSWFSGYCRAFYTGNENYDRNISLKEEHTGRVRDNIRLIAGSIGATDGDLLLAETIALLHDVGRFPQYQRYRTFKDSISVNHAALGGEVLRSEAPLDKLPSHEQDVIVRTVCLHNVYALPATLDSETSLFLKMVRDADKLDIWRVFIEFYGQTEDQRASAVGLGFPDLPGCSPEVVTCLQRREMVRLDTVRCLNDFKLLQVSWVYDLNFSASFRILLERDLIGRLAKALPRDEGVQRVVASLRAWAETKSR